MKKAKVQSVAGLIIGYCRVSTDKQDAERQSLDIMRWAEAEGVTVGRMVTETISSRKTERAIYRVVEELKAGDTLVVTELSRLARSMIELNAIIAAVLKKGAVLRVTDGQKVDETIQSQALVFALGIAAQVEREMVSERTKSALRARKEAGVRLGRPEGTRKAAEVMKKTGVDEALVRKMLSSGASAAAVARMLEIDRRTVARWMKEQEVKS